MKFTIYGNQEDEKGNPLGYHRTTQNSKWNEASQRYEAWKAHVVYAFEESAGKTIYTSLTQTKPIDLRTRRAHMIISIYYANDKRSDPSNVFKGIEDALFMNDKNVSGHFDFDFDKENPRVEVEILPVP